MASQPIGRYPYARGTKCCSVVVKQLVIRPFWADFDLRDRPPVYKAAALPIELRRHPHRRLAQAHSPTVRVELRTGSTLFIYEHGDLANGRVTCSLVPRSTSEVASGFAVD